MLRMAITRTTAIEPDIMSCREFDWTHPIHGQDQSYHGYTCVLSRVAEQGLTKFPCGRPICDSRQGKVAKVSLDDLVLHKRDGVLLANVSIYKSSQSFFRPFDYVGAVALIPTPPEFVPGDFQTCTVAPTTAVRETHLHGTLAVWRDPADLEFTIGQINFPRPPRPHSFNGAVPVESNKQSLEKVSTDAQRSKQSLTTPPMNQQPDQKVGGGP